MTREAQESFKFSPSTEGHCLSIKATCQTVGGVEWSWDRDAQKKTDVITVLPPPPARWILAYNNAQDHQIGKGLVGFLQINQSINEPKFLEGEMEIHGGDANQQFQLAPRGAGSQAGQWGTPGEQGHGPRCWSCLSPAEMQLN